MFYHPKFSSMEDELATAGSVIELKERLQRQSKKILDKEISLKEGRRVSSSTSTEYKEVDLVVDRKHYTLTFKNSLNTSLVDYICDLVQEKLKQLAIFSDSDLSLQAKVKGRTLEEWQKTFADAVPPFALLDHNKEVLFHNLSFVQLNLGKKEHAALRPGQQVSAGQQLYRFERISIEPEGFELIYFLALKELLEKNKNPSAEELGIISSSIAHELNNPLGGISAALDVLLIDDLDDQNYKLIKDMKKGIFRCKKLVETFLGFSRLSQNESARESDIKTSLTSALELVRFRLLEGNMRINPDCRILNDFKLNFNPHVLSMIFYMIIGEMLTAFGHQNLVRQERSLNFHFSFFVYADEILLANSHELVLPVEFYDSKLLNHLLETQALQLHHSGAEVRLTKVPWH